MSVGGEKVGQDQIHALLFEDKLSWQAIIYDLINSEQLDPWDIDLSLLAAKFFERIRALEEANFFVSSKVLLAAALLLRIKSDILLTQDLPALDELLSGKKEEKKYTQERIELDEDIPLLVPRTPLPRFRKVTLEELMHALDTAIKTETRRIKREILFRQQEREIGIALPKRSFNLQDKIRDLYRHLETVFSSRTGRLAFSELTRAHSREERVIQFVALLHLDTQQRVWLEQEGHFEEIWIWLKTLYEEVHKERLSALRAEVAAFMQTAEKEQEASDAALHALDTLDDEDEPEIDSKSSLPSPREDYED